MAQRRDYNTEREEFGDFADLYSKNAPANSIGAGHDYGRLSRLRELGISTDVSVVERLMLGDARCHSVTYQVEAYGEKTRRMRLQGHTIIFPQAPVHNITACGAAFGVATVKAALANVHILFVGPKGNKTKLELAALRMCKRDGDLRLRPEVLFNFLKIKEVMMNGKVKAPTLAELESMLAEHNVEAHIRANGPCIRYDENDALARLAEPSTTCRMPPVSRWRPWTRQLSPSLPQRSGGRVLHLWPLSLRRFSGPRCPIRPRWHETDGTRPSRLA